MGQYHYAVNVTKKEYLNPHEFTDGLKLLEWGQGGLTTIALALLLAVSNNRGGGDLYTDDALVGSWGGDRIAVIGDYWEEEEGKERELPTWEQLEAEYKDVSKDILKVMVQTDDWLKQMLLDSVKRYDWGKDWTWLFTPEELAK